MTHSAQARRHLSNAIRRQGPTHRNLADSIRDGGYVNFWVEAALAAIDEAIRTGPDDAD